LTLHRKEGHIFNASILNPLAPNLINW